MDNAFLGKLLVCTETAIDVLDMDSSEDEEVASELLNLCKDVYNELKDKKTKIWIKPWRTNRTTKGSYSFLTKELQLADKSCFFNYLRMNNTNFQLLLSLIEKDIVKKNTVMRESIPPSENLAATLRYLATGESYKSTDYQTRLSQLFLTYAVPEVCKAIWDNLKSIYLKFPSSKSTWTQISEKFAMRWQFPNCLGALDGKHIVFKSLMKHGAYYHNYKGSNSLILLALVDANCKFIYVDIGCNGRTNDAGVLLESSLRTVIVDADNQFPEDRTFGNNRRLPYVIVGGDAFPLQKHIMKPYPYATQCKQKRVFNARLSRARHVVEHAFGLLAQRFRIFKTTIDLSVDNVEHITKACVVLHNFLIQHNETFDLVQLNTESTSSSPTLNSVYNPHRGAAERIRETFAQYLLNEGKVDWQLKE